MPRPAFDADEWILQEERGGEEGHSTFIEKQHFPSPYPISQFRRDWAGEFLFGGPSSPKTIEDRNRLRIIGPSSAPQDRLCCMDADASEKVIRPLPDVSPRRRLGSE
jgi:hypothetical protein